VHDFFKGPGSLNGRVTFFYLDGWSQKCQNILFNFIVISHIICGTKRNEKRPKPMRDIVEASLPARSFHPTCYSFDQMFSVNPVTKISTEFRQYPTVPFRSSINACPNQVDFIIVRGAAAEQVNVKRLSKRPAQGAGPGHSWMLEE